LPFEYRLKSRHWSAPEMRPDPSGASSSRSQSLQGEAGSFGGARPKNASNQSLASTPASSSNPPFVLPFSPVYSPYQDDPFAPSPWGFYSPQTRNPEWDPLQFPCLEPIQETPPASRGGEFAVAVVLGRLLRPP
jgi:hypothetical protein